MQRILLVEIGRNPQAIVRALRGDHKNVYTSTEPEARFCPSDGSTLILTAACSTSRARKLPAGKDVKFH